MISELGAALGVSDEAELVVRHSMAFKPTLEWGGLLVKQRAHCTESNHGMPWYDFIRYSDPSAPDKVGFGRVLHAVYGIGGRPTRALVVQRLELAAADEGCVRTRFGFTRLRWSMAGGAAVPSLSVVGVKGRAPIGAGGARLRSPYRARRHVRQAGHPHIVRGVAPTPVLREPFSFVDIYFDCGYVKRYLCMRGENVRGFLRSTFAFW